MKALRRTLTILSQKAMIIIKFIGAICGCLLSSMPLVTQQFSEAFAIVKLILQMIKGGSEKLNDYPGHRSLT